jgi:predicted TIM-barrel fold metal-dependent hydrolase
MKKASTSKQQWNNRAGIVSEPDSMQVESLTRRQFLVAAGAASLSALAGTKSEAQSGVDSPVVQKAIKHIDVHHHFIPPQYLKEGPASVAMSKVDNWSPIRAVEDMDRNGIDISILSFSSPYLWLPGLDNGRKLARLCNNYSAQIVRDHPHRFGLFAGVPPLADVGGCMHEIEYALDELHAHGITVMTSYGNSWLGDPAFAPVWDELNSRDAVVFVHPAIPACCTSLGQGVPPGYLELPFDTARSVTSLWFSGALERWSSIRFIFSHGGGALPMVADRIDKFGRPGKEPGSLHHDAATQFDKLYFDTANAANPAAFAGLRAFANPRRILFGTDYPYVPLERGVDDLVRAEMSPQQRQAIESDNALSLMPTLVSSGDLE